MNNISRNNGATTPNVLCLASYEKGHRFLTEGRKLGRRVYLITSAELRDAGWLGESVDVILFMPGDQSDWNLEDMLVSIAGLRCHVHLGRVVALDDCDVEKAALLREHFRRAVVFTIRLLPRNSPICSDLLRINHSVLKFFGLDDAASHTEVIRSRDTGDVLFLETNLSAEWARLEGSIVKSSSYSAPEMRDEYAGLGVSLARQDWPDTSVFSDPGVVWKLAKRHHAGLVVSSSDDRRVAELIDLYTETVRKDFHATAPARQKVGC